MVRINGYGLAASHEQAARDLLNRVSFIELAPPVLDRALQPFPQPLRTLDALHLSSLLFLRSLRIKVSLAAYDGRMKDAAESLEVPLYSLDSSQKRPSP